MNNDNDPAWLTDPYHFSSYDGELLHPIACGRCAYWYRFEGTADGECRRYAPKAAPILLEQILEALNKIAEPTEAYKLVLWPEVSNDDWCGDFTPRKGLPHEGR